MAKKRPARNWRNIPDEILLAKSDRTALDKPDSLHPTEGTMIRYASPGVHGHEEAVVIIHSYCLLALVITMAVIDSRGTWLAGFLQNRRQGLP